MKKIKQSKTFWLAAAAVILAGGLQIRDAMAYFTTHVEAMGGYEVKIEGGSSVIEEEVKDMTKYITLANNGNCDCYVRVKLFAGDEINITYSGNKKWSRNKTDGYWYYGDIVPAGGKTKTLEAKIKLPAEFQDTFDVIVVQETTPVLYKSDGTPYADWERQVDTTTDIGTAN